MPSTRKSQDFLPVAGRVSIFLRSKTWYVNYQHDGCQVRRSLGTGNKKEAILRAQRIEADLDRGAAANEVQIATIGDVIGAFLQATELDNRAPKTLAKYRLVKSRIRTLAEIRRRTHIAHLNPQFADAFRAGLKQTGLSRRLSMTRWSFCARSRCSHIVVGCAMSIPWLGTGSTSRSQHPAVLGSQGGGHHSRSCSDRLPRLFHFPAGNRLPGGGRKILDVDRHRSRPPRDSHSTEVRMETQNW